MTLRRKRGYEPLVLVCHVVFFYHSAFLHSAIPSAIPHSAISTIPTYKPPPTSDLPPHIPTYLPKVRAERLEGRHYNEINH